MIFLKRLLPFLTGLLHLLALEGMLAAPRAAWWFVVLATAAFVASWTLLTAGRMRGAERWGNAVLPLLLVLTSVSLVVLSQDALFVQTTVLMSALLVWWYLENLYLFHFRPRRYQPYALENISGYMNLLVAFLFFASLFAARVFLNLPLAALLPAGFLVTTVLLLQAFWGAKVPWARGWPLLTIVLLVLFELLGVVSMLPTSYFVSGLLMTIPYYLMVNLARHWLRDRLTLAVIRRHLAIGVGALAVTLLSAPWS